MKTISFIIPVYNVPPEFFSSCLFSIFKASKNISYEIIICNDGSNKENTKFYENFISEYKNIRYLKNELCLGINHARNKCIEISEGEWLSIVDADDVITIDYIDAISKFLSFEYSLIYADHVQYDQSLNTPLQIRKKSIYQNLLLEYGNSKNDPLLWATFIFHPQIFRRDVLMSVGMFSTNYTSGDEVDVHIKIAQRYGVSSIHHLPSVIYKYRKNNTSVVHNESYYNELIVNIETILSTHYFQRTHYKTKAIKIGRCNTTNAAHYAHIFPNGEILSSPWFDMKNMEIIYNKTLHRTASCR